MNKGLLPLLPASIKSPIFTLRRVMTPSKGAMMRVKDCNSLSLSTFASATFRLERACS